MRDCDAEKENPGSGEIVLGGVEVHVKFTRFQGDPGIQLDLTAPAGTDGAPEGIEDINARLAGLCRATVMNMDDPARLRLLALVEQDGGNDRILYRLVVTVQTAADGSHVTRLMTGFDPAFALIDAGVAGRVSGCREQIERLLAGKVGEDEYESEEMFEILEKTNYPLDIKKHTEEEARAGDAGRRRVHAPRDPGDRVCRTVPGEGIAHLRLHCRDEPESTFIAMDEGEDPAHLEGLRGYRHGNRQQDKPQPLCIDPQDPKHRELCLYRLSVWCSMSDGGSPCYSARDRIDPELRRMIRRQGKSDEARRLAGMVMDGALVGGYQS